MATALLVLAALTCAGAEMYKGADEALRVFHGRRSIEATDSGEIRGCMYSGRWYAEGAAVRARDACLRCRCARGALTCARAACAPAPDPPPRRCALLHRRDVCCPELHCPDGVRSLELEAAGRLEEEAWDVATPSTRGHACVEEGSVFAAGSALAGRAACEQCFCLGGARRCVRPRCLPPPRACAPRPAPGVCCPARYYCEKHAANTTTTNAPSTESTISSHHLHDCKVNGNWIPEGEQVAAGATGADNCTRCFCLRGAVRCQPQACAPALRGCQPLLRPGQCCPHQYHCPHSNDPLGSLAPVISAISDNSLTSKKNEDRSFRSSASTKSAFVPRTAPASDSTMHTASDSAPSTTKVKRKTIDPPPSTKSQKTTPKAFKDTSPEETISKITSAKVTLPFTTSTTVKLTKEPTTTTTTKLVSSTETTTAAQAAEPTTTEQPEESVKVIINGTINCTAELSSTFTNMTANETQKIEKEIQPRIPENSNIEAQTTTLEQTDIITDRNYGVGYVEGDSFIINVTSSLHGNSSRPLSPPASAPVFKDIDHTSNMTKKTKEEYDYDYLEPTLPPSVPNLKIIPFVAADAVLDEESPAEDPYPMIEREDKFPVYYPTIEQKELPYATRREDVYNPTQYPVFISEKPKRDQFPKLPPIVEVKKPVTSPPTTSTVVLEHTVPTPKVNLFSPPAETEGGFIPKGPGLIDEYYAVYPSSPPPVPHLTTSMQINLDSPDKVECVTADGRRVPEGESVRLACSVCSCAWAELHCAPRRCAPAPPACRRRPASASSGDLCCGEIICPHDNTTTASPILSTRKTEISLNVSKVPIEIESYLIPFDPPADRSVPEPSNSAVGTPDIKLQENQGGDDAPHVTSVTPATPAQTTLNIFTSMPISLTKENLTTPSPETSSSTETSPTSVRTSTEQTTPEHKDINNNVTQTSQEYEDEDEDEGFSFGSVLKLLLSDNYDATSTPKKKWTTAAMTSPYPTTTTPRPQTTRRLMSKLTPPPFISVQPHAFIPPKKLSPQNTVNRIDHLVLGEATAIKKTTPRPVTHSFRPISTPIRKFSTTTRKPIATTRITTKVTKVEEMTERTPSTQTARPSSNAGGGGGGGAGLLKLAGCNIYGRMYRVGRIIAELSTPCQECRCTELGVQCLPLRC